MYREEIQTTHVCNAGARGYVSRFVRSIIAMALLLIGYLAAPCGVTAQTMRSTAAGIPSRELTGATRAMMIFVARRRWHVDVGFAAADLGAPLDALAAQFPGVKYLFFGFGDRRYLMAKHQALPAMLGNSHLQYLGGRGVESRGAAGSQ